MLVDLPTNWIDLVHPVYQEHMKENDVYPDRLAQGLWEAQMLGFDGAIRPFIAQQHPFFTERRALWNEIDFDDHYDGTDEASERMRTRSAVLPSDYGTCNLPQEILDAYPELASSEVPYLVLVERYTKATVPDDVEWDGPFLGTPETTNELICHFEIFRLHSAEYIAALKPIEFIETETTKESA